MDNQQSQQLRRLTDLIGKGLPEGEFAEINPHLKDFGVCEIHGKYQRYKTGSDGVARAIPACEKCRRLKRIERNLGLTNTPKRFYNCTFDNYLTTSHEQGLALIQCRTYAENFAHHKSNGACLIMCGNPGTGKNHLATAIIKHVIEDDYTAQRIKATEYLDKYWGKSFSEREELIKSISDIDLLMIDEVGRSSNAKAAQDAFFRLIDARYEAQLPTLIATNLNREGLIEVLDSAAYDRLRQGGILLTFSWESYRGVKNE